MTKTGYICDTGSPGKFEQEDQLIRAGCTQILREGRVKGQKITPLLDEYLAAISKDDELTVCDLSCLSRDITVVADIKNRISGLGGKLTILNQEQDGATPESDLVNNLLSVNHEWMEKKLDEIQFTPFNEEQFQSNELQAFLDANLIHQANGDEYQLSDLGKRFGKFLSRIPN